MTYFSFSLAYHLPDNSSVHSFKFDQPIDIQRFVSTFTHELLHNFTPGEELQTHYDKLLGNPLFSKTREILHHYWGEPPTEDLFCAAEQHLMTKMGVVSSEQAFHHLCRNLSGAGMLAVILYDYMDGGKLNGKNYEGFLIDLLESGEIQTETLEHQFRAVLEKRVGTEQMNAIMEKIEREYAKIHG
jgi:hypothetical protein